MSLFIFEEVLYYFVDLIVCLKGWELPQSKDYSGAKWRAQYPEPINLKPEPNQENLEPSMTPDEEDINHDVTETAHREKSAKTKNQHVKSKATSSIGKAGSGQSKLENIELTKLKDDLSTRKDNQSADKHELSSLTSTKQEVQEHHEVAEAIGKTEGEVTLKTEQGQNGFERRALTVKERLEICQATERKRLSFCKVISTLYRTLYPVPHLVSQRPVCAAQLTTTS